MATDAVFQLGHTLSDRIKSAAKLHDIDTRMAAERMLCEQISRGLTKYLKPKHMIKGGCLHAQTVRETGDLDILFERRITEDEMHRAFRQMMPDFEGKGIVLEIVGRHPEPLWIDGHHGERYRVKGIAGATPIDTHIDATGGVELFPKFQPERRHGGVFFKGQEPHYGTYQTFESQAADKLAAVVLNNSMKRWKDFADLQLLFKMQLDPHMIADELKHKLRKILPTSIQMLEGLPPLPDTLSFNYIECTGAVWKAWQAKHGKQVSDDFTDVACDARHLYGLVREAIKASYRPSRPTRGHRPTIAELKAAYIKLRKEKDAGATVVQLGHYRIDEAEPAPSYRPKGF